MHVRRIELGQTYRASPASPMTAAQWKWRERGALPQVFILASVASESEPTETGKFTFEKVNFSVDASFNIPYLQ